MSKSTIRNIIIALILIAASAGSFTVMLFYLDAQGIKLTEQITALQSQQSQQESHFRLLRISEDTKEKRSTLQNYFFIKEGDSIDFLNRVEELAPKMGVTLQTDGLELVDGLSDDSTWIEVGFSVSGPRERLQTFVDILENLPYVSRVMAVNLTALSSTQWQASVTMRVRVLDYDK